MGERLPKVRVGESANDRFKARWSSYVSVSIVAAAVIHAAVLVLGPSWTVKPTIDDTSPEITYLTQAGWYLPAESGPGSGDPSPIASYVESDDAEADTGEPAGGGGGGGDGGGDGGGGSDDLDVGEMLRQRLLRGGPPLPTVTQPEPPPEPEPAVAENTVEGDGDASTTTIDNEPTTAEFNDLLELSPLDLDRLSAVQPEIVLGAYSNWPLVRNPTEVVRFMTGAYASGRVDPGASGTVSVTVWIDERGSVGWAEISESSGRPDMDELALALFNEVVAFRPARRGGIAVPISVTFWVNLPWLRGLLP